jgi:peptide-methionine (S)-S-oxide reductase
MTKLVPNTAPPGKEIATLAGGCFWCLEAVYDQLKGVESVESGYTGGQVINPTYRQVCDGDTGHAEVVRITYDPGVVSFGDLLDVFFVIHDPTQLNRQGNDVGTQYRSAVFYHSPEQKRIAQEKIAALAGQGVYEDRIVTEIAEAGPFYVAEDYHQEYFANNPYQGYCMAVVAPKVAKFRKHFIDKLRAVRG